MFRQPYRLRHEKDIKTLFTKGKSVFNPVCGIKFRPNSLEKSRFAVVVGTKVSKKAVERNRLRRKVRSVVEEHLDQIKSGYDVAFLIRPKADGIDKVELGKQTMIVLKKANLL